MKKTIFLMLVSITAFAQTQPLEMKSNTEGFSIGISGNSLGWSSDYFTRLDDEEPSGFGLGGEIGYGFTQRLELIARLDYSTLALNQEWDYFSMTNFDIMARFNLGSTTKRFRPYAELGVGNQSMSISPILLNNQLVTYDLSGVGFAYGAGLNFFLSRNFLLTLNASGTTGNMSNFTVDGEGGVGDVPDVSNFRVRLGARFYFKDL